MNAGQVDPTLPEYRVLPHVNGERIEGGTGRLVGIRTAEQDGMTSGKYLFEPGCVLYSKLRPYLRKVAVADFAGVCSADMYPLIPEPGVVDPHFLCWLLLSEDFTAYADEESRRARMPKLNRDQLFAWVAPLPPLGEQRRIAGILKEQMEAVERARVAAEEQLEAAKALPAAFLRDVFNSNDALSWPQLPVADLIASPLRTGISRATDPTADVRCLTLSAVRDGRLNVEESKPVPLTPAEAEKYQTKAGAFYAVRGNGNRSLVGRAGRAPATPEPVAFPDLLIEVVPDESRRVPEFFRFAWDSPDVRGDIEERARTAAGIF